MDRQRLEVPRLVAVPILVSVSGGSTAHPAVKFPNHFVPSITKLASEAPSLLPLVSLRGYRPPTAFNTNAPKALDLHSLASKDFQAPIGP
jgi:hypothetical protein